MAVVLWVIGDFLQFLVIYIFMTNIRKLKCDPIRFILPCACYVLVGSILNYYAGNIIVNTIFSIGMGIFILCCFTYTNFFVSAMLNILLVSGGGLSELLVVLAMQIFHGDTVSIILSNKEMYYLAAVFSRAILLGFVRGLIACMKLKNYVMLSGKNIFLFTGSLVSYLLIIMTLSYFIKIETSSYLSFILVILMAMIIIYLSILYLLENMLRYEEGKKEMQEYSLKAANYQKNYENVLKFYQEMRSVRHDMKNMMIAMEGCTEGIELREELMEAIEKKVDSITPFCNSGNVIVDSIINDKQKEAEKCGGYIRLSLLLNQQFHIDAIDWVILLGNLLDNAIEAVTKTKDKGIVLKVKTDFNNLLLSIENHYVGDILEDNGIIKSTKEKDGRHGIGLKNVKRVVKKYHGDMSIEKENQRFLVKIILYR